MDTISSLRLLRLEEIIGRAEITPERAAENRKYGRRPRRPRPAIPAIIPVSKSTWELGIRDGRFPPGRLLGRVRVWTLAQVEALAREIAARSEAHPRAQLQNPRVTSNPEEMPEVQADCEERYARIREILGYDPRDARAGVDKRGRDR